MQDKYQCDRKRLQSVLAQIIKTYRLEQNKSISLISDEIGMTKSMWADLEKSKKDPQLSTLWRIAEGLDIPLSEIIMKLESCLEKDFSLINV